MSSSAGEREGQQRESHRNPTERYRRAAEDALQQLDWCIGYIHGIRRPRISRALARNRGLIRKNLLHQPEQPLPTTPKDD